MCSKQVLLVSHWHNPYGPTAFQRSCCITVLLQEGWAVRLGVGQPGRQTSDGAELPVLGTVGAAHLPPPLL